MYRALGDTNFVYSFQLSLLFFLVNKILLNSSPADQYGFCVFCKTLTIYTFLCSARYDRRDIMFPGCPSFRPSVHHTLGVQLRVQRLAKAMHFQQNIMHAFNDRCAPHILFRLRYNLLIRSCLTWIFFVDPHWWALLCMQRPTKARPFQQIIIIALQCQRDVDVHLLFCFDLDLLITCSRGHV